MSFRLRGHRSKTRANMRIQENSAGFVVHTKLEIDGGKLLEEMGHHAEADKHHEFVDPETNEAWTLQIDHQWKDILFFWDGPIHDTVRQAQKDHWRDSMIKADGRFRVIRVPWQWMDTLEHQAMLKPVLKSAIESTERVKRLAP